MNLPISQSSKKNIKQPSGMLGFTIVWFGQVISLMGTTMSGFALGIWAWQATQSATAMAIIGICNFLPGVLFSPVAGALVDRWNRKLVLMLSDLASGLVTVGILLLHHAGSLEMWHLYVGGVISGTFQAFQWPAYSAAISIMVPKKQYTRAAGMMSLAEWGSGIFSPVLAGALLGTIGLDGILVIDILTFIIAISALLWIFIPQAEKSEEGEHAEKGIFKESIFGFKYILKRPSLFNLQLVFASGNFMSSWAGVLLAPMILARTGNSASTLGVVESAGALGGIIGSSLITAWGGPKRRINGVLLGWAGSGSFGLMLLGLSSAIPFWLAGSFFFSFFGPIVNSSNQAIWQSKVPPDIQGRVFSVRRVIAQITGPLGMMIAGPMADKVFEPFMQSSSGFSLALGKFFGNSLGSGMSILILLMGLITTIIGLAAYLNPLVRNVETLLPDHDLAKIKDPKIE